MAKIVVFAVTSVALLMARPQAATVPVWDGSLAPPKSVEGEICNLAVITAGKPIAVRNGPGSGYRTVATLSVGATVYTCNDWGRHWTGVAYRSPDRSCEGATPDGIDIRLTPRCGSGWVPTNRVEILSG